MEALPAPHHFFTKRQIHLFLISLAFLAIALAYDYYCRHTSELHRYTSVIEADLHEKEQMVIDFVNDRAFIKRLLQDGDYDNYSIYANDQDRLEQLTDQDFTILIYKNEQLAFWTNNFVLPPAEETSKKGNQSLSKLIKLDNGYYELLRYPYLDKDLGTYSIFALIPIKYDYRLRSAYLHNTFASEQYIPEGVTISGTVSDYPVSNVSGQPIAFLQAAGPIKDISSHRILLGIYVLSFLFLAFFINSVARRINRPEKPWLGSLFLIVSVFGLRGIMAWLGFGERFSMLPIFSTHFTTSLSHSLGDLLINILLLLWIMIFFHKESPLRSFSHLSAKTKFAVSTLNYFSVLIGIFFITNVFKALVFNTGISFDFDNVFNLDRFSLLAIIGVILLLIALFLFGHRMMLTISKIGLDRHVRLMALGLATFIASPILLAADLMLPSLYLLLIAFVFLLIFDLFIDSKSINFTWLVIWLVILSAFPSILLFKYNTYKDRLQRISYAKELSDFRDTLAEQALALLSDQVLVDDFTLPVDSNGRYDLSGKDEIRKRINQHYSSNNYLFYNYQYDIFAFDNQKESVLPGQKESYQFFENKTAEAHPLRYGGHPMWLNQNKSAYLLELTIPKGVPDSQQLTLVLDFDRNRRYQSMVYTELLVDQQYKNLQELDQYDYGIYKNGQLVDSEGAFYSPMLNVEVLPPPRQATELLEGKRTDIVYTADDSTVVIVGKNKELFIKAISLFSYIFSMLIALILVFTVINTFAKILPPALSFSFNMRPSLKNRIQLSVISLIIASFIIIGFVTVWFFRTSSEEYHEKRLERKTMSVLRNAIHDVELISEGLSDSLDLGSLVAPLSKIHRIDINMYDTNGDLFSSSEEDIFDKGVISQKMPTLPYRALHLYGDTEYIHERERIGDLVYKSAYVPLKVKTEGSEQTLAYLGLPYYSKQSKQRSDVSVFMSTLLNVYVFLLLIAGGIAIAVANSITRPLAKIGAKLKQVKLGMHNEPLEWRSQDELGVLIEEYNRMIKKIEESAEKLAQSEREGAWREMAKQVAHEIKNPLTPMKLSIQYLQHAYRSNPDDIEPLMQRVSGTLIEQIDNLAQIAGEFSSFAKMPRAENQQIVLNDLVRSVFDLFSNESHDMQLELDLILPSEDFHVYADKNHLMRVLNNLIKNAIQAIPDGRSGQILVSLYRKTNEAIIQVTDNGSGIPNDKREKVFVPNFTTKNSGTGLGLAISKNIIESVNGKIYFETEVNKGTDFYVHLPLVDVTELQGVD